VFPFAFRMFRWSLEDPGAVQGSPEDRLAAFRRVRNQLDHNVREFLMQVSGDRLRTAAMR